MSDTEAEDNQTVEKVEEETTNTKQQAQESNVESTNKRKRSLSEEHGAGNYIDPIEEAKKIKLEIDNSLSHSNSAYTGHLGFATVANGHGNVISNTGESIIMEVGPDKVGQIIGTKGMIIQEVQARTGVKAYINQDLPPGVNRQLHLSGTKQQIEAACDLVRRIIAEGPTAIHLNSIHGGPPASRIIECSQPQVGKIIGTGGVNIRDIQSKSGAKIQIEQDFPPEVPRKIHISGSTAAVNVAVQLIMDLMQNIINGTLHNPATMASPYAATMASPYAAPGGYSQPTPTGVPGEFNQSIDVPKAIVGKIIGRAGETVQLIQRKSGCRVTVDQNVPEGHPCHVNMVGTTQNIALVLSMINEIQVGVHSSKIGANLPAPSTGAPSAYGMPPAQGYGMPGAAQGYPMPGYGYPPQQMAYGQYGMPPAGAYGGYPYGMPGAAAATAAAPAQYGQAAPQYSHQPAAAAAAPKPAAAASVWTEHKTDDGLTYWYNASTGVSQWERPKTM